MGLLGKYEILEQLGGGAMGNVYSARDTTLERKVALKTIRTGVDVDPVVRQRFYTEARACARLHHPSIITVYDLGEVENTAYIAMELLSGSDFRRIIQDRSPLPLAAKVSAIAQVCEAIAHAHKHGVVHRDIKPSNLFLTDDGRAKVLDFGIARLPSSRLTIAGQILGTPNYMAPEQILDRPTDGRADLFSVAVVFFELLTYTHPFHSNSIPRRIVQSDPDSLFSHDSTLPLILEKVMARGLAKEPDLRYQSGDHFAADLYAVIDLIRQNASPSFSRVELPSQRAPAVAVPEAIGVAIAAPAGADPHEWRLSEALRLLPEFETAMDHGDVSKAQAAFADLKARLAGDLRFSAAMRQCESRLVEIVSAAPVLGGQGNSPAAADFSHRVPSAPPAEGPTANATAIPLDPDITAFCAPPANANSYRTFLEPTWQPEKRVIENQPVPVPDQPETQPPLPTPDSTATVKAAGRNAKPIIIIVAGIAVCTILLLAAGIMARQPVPVQPAAATALVVRDSVLYERPATTERTISLLAAGSRINVLRLPDSPNQDWIRVQSVMPKVLRPGYVQLGGLRDWQGTTGDSALALAHAFSVGNSATDVQIAAQIRTLNEVASRFSAEPAANQARLDIIQWKLILARRHHDAGAPADELQRELASVREDLPGLASEPGLQTKAEDLIKQTEELISAVPPPPPPVHPAPAVHPPPPVAPPPIDLRPLLLRAQQLWEAGDYDQALSTLRTILQQDAGNKQALSLKARIDRAVALEKQYEKK